MVANMYPYYLSRVDVIKDDKERLTIPLTYGSDDGFTIRIQVLSPLFRNPVGQKIVQASIWSPVKWIILALSAFFAEQIKKGIFVPIIRRLFSLLGIPFFEDNKKSGEGKITTLVFQYGSNTSSKRMNSYDRMQSDACPVGIVYTEDDFDLEFTVWSQTNECAAANIVSSSAGRKIWGVLYEIPDYLIRRETSGSRKSLDAIEGEGQNYQRTTIALRYPNGLPVEREVITYVVSNRRSGLRTSLEYALFIIRGLREHNVLDDYIEYVKARVIANNPDLRHDIEAIQET